MIYKMEMHRRLNNELASLYFAEMPFGVWLRVWKDYGPKGAGRTFNPRVIARWYMSGVRVV